MQPLTSSLACPTAERRCRPRLLLTGFALLVVCACAQFGELAAGSGRAIREVTRGPAREPAQTPLGSDRTDLPERFPEAEWLPNLGPVLALNLEVDVEVNGMPVRAKLDTGAVSVFMSEPVAYSLGYNAFEVRRGRKIKVLDAHGEVAAGWEIDLDEVVLGTRRWENVTALVSGESPDKFIIGYDILQYTDLYIAGDEGVVGVFPVGRGPAGGGDVVGLISERRQLLAVADAPGTDGNRIEVRMLVDTGAWNTSFPVTIGVNGGVPTDLRFAGNTVGAVSTSHSRGRFVLDPLTLGPHRIPVGRVYAWGAVIDGGETYGLLGNDVLMRHHTIIRPRDAQLILRPLPHRPAFRTLGPGGQACRDGDDAEIPCLRVSLGTPAQKKSAWARDDLCMQIDIEPVWAGKTLELTITAATADGKSAFSGGAILHYVSVATDGFHNCQQLHRGTAASGLEARAEVSLQRVRVEGYDWPCDPAWSFCTLASGPVSIAEPSAGVR